MMLRTLLLVLIAAAGGMRLFAQDPACLPVNLEIEYEYQRNSSLDDPFFPQHLLPQFDFLCDVDSIQYLFRVTEDWWFPYLRIIRHRDADKRVVREERYYDDGQDTSNYPHFYTMNWDSQERSFQFFPGFISNEEVDAFVYSGRYNAAGRLVTNRNDYLEDGEWKYYSDSIAALDPLGRPAEVHTTYFDLAEGITSISTLAEPDFDNGQMVRLSTYSISDDKKRLFKQEYFKYDENGALITVLDSLPSGFGSFWDKKIQRFAYDGASRLHSWFNSDTLYLNATGEAFPLNSNTSLQIFHWNESGDRIDYYDLVDFTDPEDVFAYARVTFHYANDNTNAVSRPAVLPAVSVTPNPVSRNHWVDIALPETIQGTVQVIWTALDGRTIYRTAAAATDGSLRLEADVPAGMYLIQIQTQNHAGFQPVKMVVID